MAKETLDTEIFPISVEFYPGEQPQAGKLTGLAVETEAGIEALSDAIGDTNGEKADENKLFYHADRPANINSLARAIGPMSMLSALRPVANTFTTSYTIPAGVNEFQLPYPPFVITLGTTNEEFSVSLDETNSAGHIRFELNEHDTTAFGQYDSNLDSVGDYYIDNNGRVFTYTKTAGCTITYQYQLYPDAYPEAGMNVIPDWNQDTNLCVVTYPTGQSYALLTLPTTISKTQLVNSAGTAIGPGDLTGVVPPTTYSTSLPSWLTDSHGMSLTVGSDIPLGYIKIWKDGDSSLISGITQITLNALDRKTIRVYPKTAIAVGSDYRVVVSAATITETLAFMKERFDFHDHSERKHGKAIDHVNLSNVHMKSSIVSSKHGIGLHGTPKSQIEGNVHPQYVSRYGYTDGQDSGNQDGTILGNLFMATEKGSYDASGNYNDGDADSRKIYFGTTGSYIQYNNANSALALTSTNIRLVGAVTATTSVSIGGTLGVTNLLTASNGINLTGDLSLLTGHITKTGSLNITGGTGLTLAATTGGVSLTGGVSISGGLTLPSSSGGITLNNNDISGTGTLNIGAATINGLLTCGGNITKTGTLSITGSTGLTLTATSGGITLNGGTTIKNGLTVDDSILTVNPGINTTGTITYGSLSGGSISCTGINLNNNTLYNASSVSATSLSSNTSIAAGTYINAIQYISTPTVKTTYIHHTSGVGADNTVQIGSMLQSNFGFKASGTSGGLFWNEPGTVMYIRSSNGDNAIHVSNTQISCTKSLSAAYGLSANAIGCTSISCVSISMTGRITSSPPGGVGGAVRNLHWDTVDGNLELSGPELSPGGGFSKSYWHGWMRFYWVPQNIFIWVPFYTS